MSKKFKFEINEKDWNYVEEKGLPEDGTMCFLICESIRGDYVYEFGGYNERTKEFYCNFGLGGMVTDAEYVVAWVAVFERQDGFLKTSD